jgi:hypothetical protein
VTTVLAIRNGTEPAISLHFDSFVNALIFESLQAFFGVFLLLDSVSFIQKFRRTEKRA